jgi:hypothetical protein
MAIDKGRTGSLLPFERTGSAPERQLAVVRRHEVRTIHLCLILIVLGVPSYVTAASSAAPVAVLHAVEGKASVVSAGNKRAADPLAGLVPGDTVEVEAGRVVIADPLCGGERELKGPTTYVVTQPPCHPEPGLLQRFQLAIEHIRNPPRHTINGNTRGSELWPSDVRFAPNVAIVFKWHTSTPAASWQLAGPSGRVPSVTVRTSTQQVESNAEQLFWPAESVKSAGRYEWELHDANDQLLGSARFEVLTGDEVKRVRKHYEKEARQLFNGRHVALATELVAARDGYRLK